MTAMSLRGGDELLGSDRWLLAAAGALVSLSALAMISAAAGAHPTLPERHGLWIVIGLFAFAGVARSDYRRWLDVAWVAYGLSLLGLGAVLVAGAVRLGAARWLSVFGLSFQPSELAKLATVWLLARYLAGQAKPLPQPALWISLAVTATPALLIFLQPDLGSASIFGAIWLGMVWVAGLSRRAIGWLVGVVLALGPIGWHALKDYQRDRLFAFINPHADPLGAGFSIIQSTIAIGSGGLWGRGWRSGTQSQLHFVPERHSDFIFSVIGEEWGFLGCAAVAVLFGVLLSRIIHIGLRSGEPQGVLVAAGVFSWVGYQALLNMGMVMGLVPVVGVPLPLVSYGGSSMVALWVALGLLQSVRRSDPFSGSTSLRDSR